MIDTILQSAEKVARYMLRLDEPNKVGNKTIITASNNEQFFLIKPFRENEQGVNHRDTILKNMVSLKKNEITFLIRGNQMMIKMYAKLPKDYANYFQNTFYANYSTSDLKTVDPISLQDPTYITYKNIDTIKSKEAFTKDGTYMDPFTDILAIYADIPKPTTLDIFVTIRFERNFNIFRFLRKYGKKSYSYISQWHDDENDQYNTTWPQEDRKLEPNLLVSLWFAINNADNTTKKQITASVKNAFAPFSDDGKIKFKNSPKLIPLAYSQAVNFFHIPTKVNYSKWLDYTLYRKLPYPTNLSTPDNSDKDDLTILGTTDYRAEKIEFWIRKEDKLRHVYIVGKTGTGKSTFISNMVKSDMIAGNGLALLDPHGDLVETVLEHIPTHRINDVILFDVADTDYPIGFNLLQYDSEEEKNRIVSWVVSAFYRLFAHSRWPRLEYILRNVLLSVVEYPNATLMHILRILVDDSFRDEVITHIKDPLVLKFWKNEFMARQPRQREEAIAPITNKIGQFLSSSVVRNIFGQPNSRLNLRKAMDEGKIILINLSKGKIGEDNAAMIGSLLVTKFQIDAMSRADVGYNSRKDFYLYIDEFQNFATSSFTTILSEARKYKLSLIVANQFTSQLLPEIKDAIFGNIGTIISFTLWHDDASIMSSQFKELVSENDIISLPKFTAYTKLMIDGISSDPFSMKTMPLATPEWSVELKEKILKQSRQRYAQERWALENLMNAWSKKSYSRQEKVVAKAQFEALGLENDEIASLQEPFIEENISLFNAYSINGRQPDAIVFDTKMRKHKWVRYTMIANLEADAYLLKTMDGIQIYNHGSLKDGKWDPLMILIGSREKIKQQTSKSETLKFVPNIYLLEKASTAVSSSSIAVNDPATQQKNTVNSSAKPQNDKKNIKTQNNKTPTPTKQQPSNGKFSIKDIKLGEEYSGYVKLLYNYGIFVTVKWVEWLLHKKAIKIPEGVDWKKYFTIGDQIKVVAKEFKDIKWEQKVVWEMK